MFDLDATKFLIVGAAALIFIPPKDLPRVMRQAGQFVGKMKRMASEFQGQFMDAMREADMADLRREAKELSQSTRIDLGLEQLNARMTDQIGKKSAPPITKVSAYDPGVDARLPDAPLHVPDAHVSDASLPAEPVAGSTGIAPAADGGKAARKIEPASEPVAHSA